MKLFANRLTIRHLVMVVSIAEEGNLARAAKRLNMTQSAVTKALQEVEKLTNSKLFERTNRGVLITVYGDTLVEHARTVITQLSHAEESLVDLRDGTGGRVTVGTLLSASVELLPKSIARLRQERPRLIIKVLEGTNNVLMPALRAGDIDMVIGRLFEHRDHLNMVQEPLMSDVASVVVRKGHSLASRQGISLADLVDWDWILPPQDTTLRRQIDMAFHKEGLAPPAHAIESVSLLTNLGLLLYTDCIAVFPAQVAKREARSHAIAILPVVLGATSQPVGITTRRNVRLSPAAKALVDILQMTARDMAT